MDAVRLLGICMKLLERLPVGRQAIPEPPSFSQIYSHVHASMAAPDEATDEAEQDDGDGESAPGPAARVQAPAPRPVPAAPRPVPSTPMDMPTTAETVADLKRRLGKELYRMELDLAGGGRIAGKPCGCLGNKHNLGLEATAEELIPLDSNPAYNQILGWLKQHEPEFTPEQIAKHPPEYYQALGHEARAFRKAVLESDDLRALLNQDDKAKLIEKVRAMMEAAK